MFREIRAPKTFVETDGGHHDAGFTIAAKLGAALATFWPVGVGNEKSPAGREARGARRIPNS
jgi:hypothetical protein